MSSRKIANPPRSVCIVTGELEGLDMNGGIGTANLGMAFALADAGHVIEVLYSRVAKGIPHPSADEFSAQVERFARRGIALRAIDHAGTWDDWLGKSHSVLNVLDERPFDTVVFNDTHGNGYVPVLAKKTGLAALANTRLVVVAHSASQWIYDINQQPIANVAAIKQIEIERKSLELADCVISPSAYLLETYRKYGWTLPEPAYVHPNILPFSNLPPKRAASLNKAPEELVFFGRLETRKGLWLFCNALEKLKDRLVGKRVTFLGKSVPERGTPTALKLLERAKSWPFEIRLLPEYDSATALAYLARRRCVAVMPSFAENSPCAVSECLAVGIPFVATSGSGTEELVAVSDRDRCLVAPEIGALVAKLEQVLDKGLKPARPAGNPQRQAEHLVRWLTEPSDGDSANNETENLPPCLMLWPHRGEVDTKPALAALPAGSAVEVLDGSKAGLAKCLEDVDGRMVIVSEPSISISEEIIRRAAGCFAANPDIAAIGGQYDQDNPLMGPTEGMMAVCRESNGGFAFFRAEDASMLAEVQAQDMVNDRLIPNDVWLHRVFARLMEAGRSCTLLPDLFAEKRLSATPPAFEAFEPILEPAEADQGLSHVIEMAQAAAQIGERRKAAMACFDATPRAAEIVEELRRAGDTRMGMANLAQALGQPEIGLALAASVMGQAPEDDPAKLLHKEAYEISLFTLAAEEKVERYNLDHSWSYKLISGEQEIEIHANSGEEGRALLRFVDLDLSRTGAFAAQVRLPHSKSRPVLCRVEIATLDRSERVGDQITLDADGVGEFHIPIPKQLRTRCLINLSVAMAFETDLPQHCWVRWVKPTLLAEEAA